MLSLLIIQDEAILPVIWVSVLNTLVSLDGGRKNKRHSSCAIVACLNLQRELSEAMKQRIRAG